MKKVELADLSQEELLREVKNRKSSFILLCVSVSIMVVMAVINLFGKGMGIFTFFPLIFIPIMINGWKKYKEATKEKEIRSSK